MGTTRIVGVFGFPVAHTLSPAMHNAALAALNLPFLYIPFAVAPTDLAVALKSLPALGVVGVNLTIPHKEAALSLMDEITPEAREIGAVNTVHCVEGRLLGDNTDGRGFYTPLREQGVSLAGKNAVVLGAGGAARAVVFQLVREGAVVWLCNRTPERAEKLARDVTLAGYAAGSVRTFAYDDAAASGRAIAQAELLVNTTRIGMHPEFEAMPAVPMTAFHADLLVYDLVYNPIETRLLREAQARGCRTLDGLKMLVFQGAAAFQRWTGHWPPTEVMENAARSGLRSANADK